MTSNEGDSFKFEDADLNKLVEDLSNQPPIEFNFPHADLNKLLEDLSSQPPIEFNFPHADLNKLLEDLSSQPFPDISFDDEALRKIVEDISSADSELNFDFPEIDLSILIQDVEVSGIEPELIPEPDPNITAKDVADWMLNQVELKERFYQQDAVWSIRKYFGERFIYLNQNHNPAISREVLKELRNCSTGS
jgi:hypothetical protein